MSTGKVAAGKTSKVGILTLLAILVVTLILEAATSITVTGSWSLSIGQANLSGGAGSDLTST